MPPLRRQRIFPSLAAALAALLGFFACAPSLLVFLLAEWVHAATGRTLAVDAAAIQWGRETVVELRGLRVANADWGSAPWMVTLGRVELRAALASLLRGRAEFTTVQLEDGALLLEQRAGDHNWRVARPAPFFSVNGGGLPVIGALRVRNFSVRYRDPAREGDLLGALNAADGSLAAARWHLTGEGVLDRKPLAFAFNGDPSQRTLDLHLGDTLTQVRAVRGVEGYGLHAEGGDLRRAFPVIPIPFPSTPPYRFDAQIIRDGERIRLQRLGGRLGETDLRGELAVTLGAPPAITGRLHSQRLHLGDLKGFLGLPLAGPPPRPGKFFPDNPINRRRFERVALTLDYDASAVIGDRRFPIDAVRGRITIAEGQLRFDPLHLVVADGTATGALRLDVTPRQPEAELELALRDLRLGRLLARVPALDASRGRLRGHLQLRGRGESLAAIFSASHGRLVLRMTDGALARKFVDALKGDVARLLLDPDSEGDVALRCAVAVFNAEGGIARADALVIETERTLLTGRGTIDLGRERLDLTLAAAPRAPEALIAPSPLRLRGTFARPDVSLDTSAITEKALAALALGALLGPLAAVPALVEPGGEGDGACGELMQRIAPKTPP